MVIVWLVTVPGTRVVPGSRYFTSHRLRVQHRELQAVKRGSGWTDGVGTREVLTAASGKVDSCSV